MKNMKKKALMAASYVAVAALAIGGTLAYMTDDERTTNVMPLGEGVDIALIEQQRGEDGLEAFEQGKELMPIVGSAQDNNDAYGLAQAENYVDKIIRVENVGETDAYVRVLVAFPMAWDADAASDMPIHWNHTKEFDPDGDGEASSMAYNWSAKLVEAGVKIDGQMYNIYSYTYKDAIDPGYITEPAITGFYMDSRVDFDDETGKYTMNGTAIDWALDNFIVPVYAQAIQVDGFADANAAFADMTTNPWAEDGLVTPVLVETAAELATALENGGDVALTEDIEFTAYLNVAKDGVTNLNLNGNILSRSSGTGLYINNPNTVLNIDGDGKIEASQTVYCENGTVNIYSGDFHCVDDSDCIYAINNGVINIYGGTFSSEDPNFTLNLYDSSRETAQINVYGGTFKNFDPSNNAAEGPGTNFVADGYKVVEETQANGDIWYTVVAE